MPNVWIVDDMESNRQRFLRDHGATFNVRAFSSPAEVEAALRMETPDALVSDIFFYENEAEADAAEETVRRKAVELEAIAQAIDAERHAEPGIRLIEHVHQHYPNKFPVFAWTSKGPYLLQSESFRRIEQAEARWLFKNRYTSQLETFVIDEEISRFQEAQKWSRWFKNRWIWSFMWAFVGAALSALFCWL